MDIVADPTDPGPGQTTTLTITASGVKGVDKYGVKAVQVSLQLTDAPGSDAKVDPASVTTDASGTATAKLTTSKTKGRNAVTATAGTLTTQFNTDTLLSSSGTLVRGRHSGNIDPVPATAAKINPALIFAIAASALLVGFVVPYRRRIVDHRHGIAGSRRFRRAPKQRPVGGGPAPEKGWGPSSPKKSRARP